MKLDQGVGADPRMLAPLDDVDVAYAAVLKRGFPVAQELRDESFGMRRFMVADPNGLLVNIFAFPG